ncbi:MAG: ZPR1 zinc finger domain-containing protein [Candidatus Thermoplasmatota archaeon]|nr:ZPR1 zinc finger domain-containing protein [Candidatus Thermoplasmatota archaeon]
MGSDSIDSIIEQPCPICSSNDGLKMTVHIDEIPYFGEHTQITLACESCGWRRTDFIPAESKGSIGNRISIGAKTLNARVIRGSNGTIRIPELGLEVEPGTASSGYISNIEGVLTRFRDTIQMLDRSFDESKDSPEEKERIDFLLNSLEASLSGEDTKFTLVILDPMGHSGILHPETEEWSLSEDEIGQLAVGPEIPILELDSD